MKSLIVILAVTLPLLGCQTTRYELRAPATDAGRACVTQCAAIREACRGNEIRRVKGQREECERNNERVVHACLANAETKEKRAECEKKRSGCWTYEDTEPCEEEYRGCFGQCGGAVIKIVE